MKKLEQTKGIKRYTTREIHERLVKRYISEGYEKQIDFIETQALRCPYYVPLTGPLGADWGVLVNPRSSRFGMLTFEHDFCGCPDHYEKVGHQDGRDWLEDWDKYKNNEYYNWIEDED